MTIVTIYGGLGNQMFQYAFKLELERYDAKIFTTDYLIKRHHNHNDYELNTVFNIDLKTNFYIDLLVRLIRKLIYFKKLYIVKVLFFFLKLCRVNLYGESDYIRLGAAGITRKSRINVLFGYWQSEFFFPHSIDKILAAYSFNPSLLSHSSKEIHERIKQSQSVSIHIRRGDYLFIKESKIGGVLPTDYYQSAINYITERIENPVFYVFSDDIQWAKENITITNVEFISWNNEKDAWQDMFLMSKCRHNIIANSSFSWWGARLNQNKNKIVVAPECFSKIDDVTIHPADWVKI